MLTHQGLEQTVALHADRYVRALLREANVESGAPAHRETAETSVQEPPSGSVDPPVRERGRTAWRWIAVVLLPFVVSAVATAIRGWHFRPISDYALTELAVRDVLHHPVLIGLYSRSDWAHPGPFLFYALAPFSWAVGHASVGMNLGALAINGLSVAGIAIFARRRGGTALMLCALLGCALVMRTLGADFLNDPWNNYVVTLPYGLLLFSCWALMCRDRWALPVAVVVASFLAQTHVGFVVLALPLLALGTAWLVAPVLRRGTDRARRRAVLRMTAISAAVGVVLWIPPVVDALFHDNSNFGRMLHYFRTSPDSSHSLSTGWRVVSGQFGLPPEWLTSRRFDLVGYGESPFILHPPVPWLLVLVVGAAALLWSGRKRDAAGARYLAVVIGAAMTLGVVSTMQTLGPVLYYRLRWTWMIPVAAFVLVVWTAWQLIVTRWPGARRACLVVVAAATVGVTAVNVVTAATVPAPWKADSDVIAAVTPAVVEQLRGVRGQVLLDDNQSASTWYTRGLVLQLAKDGYDVRVPAAQSALYGARHVVEASKPVARRLLVVQNADVDTAMADPRYRLIARWRPVPTSSYARALRERDRLREKVREGKLSETQYADRLQDLLDGGPPHVPLAEQLAVFLDTDVKSG